MFKIKFIISIFVLAFSLASCNQAKESTETPPNDSLVTAIALPVLLSDTSINEVYQRYEDLKNMLVNSNALEAKITAAKLGVALRKIKGSENTSSLADKIANSAALPEQRVHFTALSNDMLLLFKQSELSTGNIYVQYCPMANEGEGGYWLSSQEEIMNPYYGDEMLHCGEIKETIAKK